MSAVNVQGASKIFNQGTPKQVDALVDVNLTVNQASLSRSLGLRVAVNQRCFASLQTC